MITQYPVPNTFTNARKMQEISLAKLKKEFPTSDWEKRRMNDEQLAAFYKKEYGVDLI